MSDAINRQVGRDVLLEARALIPRVGRLLGVDSKFKMSGRGTRLHYQRRAMKVDVTRGTSHGPPLSAGHRTLRGPRPLSGETRAAFRRRVFACARSPSCAMATPRSASAGGHHLGRLALSAPRGSPARACAAAVISKSIESRHTCNSRLSITTPNLSQDTRPGSERA